MPTRLHSINTLPAKWIFPILVPAFVAFFLFKILWGRPFEARMLPFVALPLVVMLYGFFTMKRFVWPAADAVLDFGDHLLVKRGSEQDRISLSNVMSVGTDFVSSTPRITLRLIEPGKFGREITFFPRAGLIRNPARKNGVAEDLGARTEKARSGLAV